MTAPTIRTLPPAPNRATDSAADFVAKADALVAALSGFVDDANAVSTFVDAAVAAINSAAATAATAATTAALATVSADIASLKARVTALETAAGGYVPKLAFNDQRNSQYLALFPFILA